MKSLWALLIVIALLVSFAACGGTNGKEGSSDNAVSKSGGKETNELSVVFNDREQFKPGAFELKKTVAYISGMYYNGKAVAKHVYVAFANYEDAKIGLYSVDLPKEPGQIVLVVSFKTENKDAALEQQMEVYNQLEMPTGTYEPGWMAPGKCFQVYYFVGGENGGPPISGQGAAGTATLTNATAKKVSGSIDFTSPNGSTIKGTFNVNIEKDLWKK